MIKKPTVSEAIRLNRLRWFGHVQRMEEAAENGKGILAFCKCQ